MRLALMKVPVTEWEYKALADFDDKHIRLSHVRVWPEHYPSLNEFVYTGRKPFKDEKYGYAVEVQVCVWSENYTKPYVAEHMDDITEWVTSDE